MARNSCLFSPDIRQFLKCFTDKLGGQFATKESFKIPPHLKILIFTKMQ